MNSLTEQIADHFLAMHFGNSMTGSCLEEHLEDLTFEHATAQVHGLNTIAKLVFHINYYVAGVLQVLQGGSLDIHDKYSYDCPDIASEADWQGLLDKLWSDARIFGALVAQIPEAQLAEYMDNPKYGNWFRNLLGMLEHSHYHLGQIALLRKIVLSQGH